MGGSITCPRPQNHRVAESGFKSITKAITSHCAASQCWKFLSPPQSLSFLAQAPAHPSPSSASQPLVTLYIKAPKHFVDTLSPIPHLPFSLNQAPSRSLPSRPPGSSLWLNQGRAFGLWLTHPTMAFDMVTFSPPRRNLLSALLCLVTHPHPL